jgi:hypothetical protein
MLFLAASCSESRLNFSPGAHWSQTTQDSVKLRILPYVAKLPKKVSHEQKWESRFIPYYKGLMERFEWRYVAPAGDGSYYFMIQRPAPSLYNKKVGIAGKVKFDSETYEILEYEEAFWTFKFKEPVFDEKGLMLFTKYVQGVDLTPYYSMNNLEEYIEFPDENNTYDKKLRRWKFITEQDGME